MASFLKKFTVRSSSVRVFCFGNRGREQAEGGDGRSFEKNKTHFLDLDLDLDLDNNTTTKRQNLAAWAVAGGIAYVLWIRPEQQKAREREEAKVRARLEAAASAPSLKRARENTDRASPTPDPQIGGLSVGNKKT